MLFLCTTEFYTYLKILEVAKFPLIRHKNGKLFFFALFLGQKLKVNHVISHSENRIAAYVISYLEMSFKLLGH